ncbi:TetR/AcrR family transcriptional regulator, partial [Segeticoccus rhizosphaerae]|uniref:TetR/AcrR family transcriptional regulator n=1 Tax=Segeticoccus rhizosphaerae TaxID=1104777 RepID=UPI001264E7CF
MAVKEGARQRHRRLRKEAFLKNATEVLSRQGFYQFSMNELAQDLGTKKIVLYRYFDSKDDLIIEVLQRASDMFLAIDALEYPSWEDALKAIVRACRKEPGAMRILARHAAHDPELSIYFERYKDVVAERTAERLMRRLANPIRGPVDYKFCGEAIANFLIDTISNWLDHGDV